MSDTVLAIVGPTAVGKTRIAFELARALGGEIISVDSRQVYRYLDIGTDKISQAERRVVPHHLIDAADPDDVFTAADFVREAEAACARIRARGKLPILAGGTPMYLRALEGSMLSDPLPRDERVRAELEQEAQDAGLQVLHARLADVDASAADKIHPNDAVRILRALEIFKLTGEPPSEVLRGAKKIGGRERLSYIGLSSPRDALYSRIDARVEEQFRNGYVDEVRWLLDNGYSPELPALRGFGYREIVEHLAGRITLEEAIAGDKRSTRAFVRRQMAWFRHFSPIIWHDTAEKTQDEIVMDIITSLEQGREQGDTQR